MPGGHAHAHDVAWSVGRIGFSPAYAPRVRLVHDRLGEGSPALDRARERVRGVWRVHHLGDEPPAQAATLFLTKGAFGGKQFDQQYRDTSFPGARPGRTRSLQGGL